MKNIDENGFWEIKNNPISRVGVFPYLGKNISDELEPDKIYYVYRPAEELFAEETLKSFNTAPVPLVDDHTMIGKGFTPAEEKGIHGVISNIRKDGENLVGDLAIYSEDMKQKISEGKKDLSMGYFCTYDLQEGTYNGQHYDAIQRDLRSNHVALVDEGRCGSSVRVFDKWCFDAAISEDVGFVEFKEEDHPRDKVGATKSQNTANKHIEKATGVLRDLQRSDILHGDIENLSMKKVHSKAQELARMHLGTIHSHKQNPNGSGEIIAKKGSHRYKLDYWLESVGRGGEVRMRFGKISAIDSDIDEEKEKMAENIEKKDDEIVKDEVIDKRELIREIGAIAGEAGMSEELVKTLMQKAEQLAYNASEESKADDACAKDEDVEEEIEEEEEVKDEDRKLSELVEKKVQDALDSLNITEMIQAKQDLISKVRPLVGDFNYSKMTNSDIAKYACDHLELKATKATAQDVLDCYLQLKGSAKVYSSEDSKPDNTDEIIEKYKRGE